jgi:hypothetical protein
MRPALKQALFLVMLLICVEARAYGQLYAEKESRV